MVAFTSVFLVVIVSAIGIAYGLNYFLRLGPWRSLGYAMLAIAAFLIFCASGLWENATAHEWGWLAPIFAIILIAGWAFIEIGRLIWGRKRK